MLKRHEDYQESLVHYCKQQREQEKVVIRIHDIHSFMDVENVSLPIKCCPFCGVDLESEL